MNPNIACHVAFAQTGITPDFPVELIGCSRPDSKAQGVLHPLYAQVLLLEFGGTYHCLVAIDSLGLTTLISDRLRAMLAEQLKTNRFYIMLNFSHTHFVPAPLSQINGE